MYWNWDYRFIILSDLFKHWNIVWDFKMKKGELFGVILSKFSVCVALSRLRGILTHTLIFKWVWWQTTTWQILPNKYIKHTETYTDYSRCYSTGMFWGVISISGLTWTSPLCGICSSYHLTQVVICYIIITQHAKAYNDYSRCCSTGMFWEVRSISGLT